MSDVQGIARDQLQSYFRRWERLEEQKQEISDDLKELFAEAKALGYDAKALRIAFRQKAKENAETDNDRELMAVVETYLEALNSASRGMRAHTRENIEKFGTTAGGHNEVTEESAALTMSSGPDEKRATNSPEEANEKPGSERSVAHTDEPKSDGDRNPVDGALVTAGETAPSFTAKPPSPLRPHCRDPEACGGYGRNHCHSCIKLMEAAE